MCKITPVLKLLDVLSRHDVKITDSFRKDKLKVGVSKHYLHIKVTSASVILGGKLQHIFCFSISSSKKGKSKEIWDKFDAEMSLNYVNYFFFSHSSNSHTLRTEILGTIQEITE